MTIPYRYSWFGGAAISLSLVGCATSSSMMIFGDTTTFGLRLGNDTAADGASVSLGYKAISAAVVPVTVLRDGKPGMVRGLADDKRTDALSVFAIFKSDASTQTGTASAASSGQVRLGQAFSTGLAAQELTLGYACMLAPNCNWVQSIPEAASAPLAASAPSAAGVPTSALASATAQNLQISTDAPLQAPLIFLRSDAIGIDIGGSLASQGLQFSLGYGNQNIALIPVYALGSDGRPVKIGGGAPGENGGDPFDSFSVVGQFDANTQTTRLDYGLDRYFATGVAARNLSMGLATAVALSKPPAPAPAAAASAGTADLAASSSTTAHVGKMQ